MKKILKSRTPSEQKISGANEFIYGAHAIIEALKVKKRRLISVYTLDPQPKSWLRVKPYLPASGNFHIQYVTREKLTEMVGHAEHMGIAAWMSSYVYKKDFFDPAKNPLVLVLDEIQDVRNLGAILRSAYCTNFDGIIISQKNCALITPDAVKASAGLAEHLNVFVAATTKQALELAQQKGYSIYLTSMAGEPLNKLRSFAKPLCLVIGNEEKGVSKELFSFGFNVCLPQKNTDISYNVSVAAGIFMFKISFDSN